MNRTWRWTVVALSLVACATVILNLAQVMGPSATSLSFIPAAAAGALLGLRRGALVGICTGVVTQLALVTYFARPVAIGDVLYFAIHVGMGASFGWLRDLRDRLRESAARSRLLFDTNPLPVFVFDKSTERFLDANAAALMTYGYTRAEWLDMRASQIRPGEDVAVFHAALASLEGAPRTFEVRHVRSDATVMDVVVTANELTLDGRDVVYAIAQDVTERKRAEASLRRSERLSALGTLVAGVAHEINNPLTYMQGNMELAQMGLEEAASDPAVPTALRKEIDEALSRQGAVLRGIEQIARITRGLRQIARRSDGLPEEVDLDSLVRDTLQIASPRMPASVEVRADLVSTRRIRLVPGEFSQVLLNLLFNAADAVQGAAAPRIAVRTRSEGDAVTIEVEDNGAGISEREGANLFVPFFTTKAHGTGLGLSISQRIVTDHGGSIAYESRPGMGTTFRVVLPANGPLVAAR